MAPAQENRGSESGTSDRKLLAVGIGAAALAAGAGALAWRNHRLQQEAEASHPPRGKFIEVDGVSLHYVDQGHGPAVVLLHGNGTTSEDWFASGIAARLAGHHRVIALDRPGFGYSGRPRSRLWTPWAQANAIALALRSLGVEGATVVGHSFGTQIAAALAIEHRVLVSRLVLLGGYYFPSPRVDVALMAPPAVPIVGDLLRYTVSPLMGAAARERLEKRIFAPAAVDPRFRNFPYEMSLRPSQVRAQAADAALMLPGAASLSKHYAELDLPVTLVAGDGDELVTTADQTEELARRLPHAELILVPGAGHMLHYTATDQVLAAIDRDAEASEDNMVELSDAPA